MVIYILARITVITFDLMSIFVEFAVLVGTDRMKAQVVR